MKNVIIHVTPEVRDLIDLLDPKAIVTPYGDGGNSIVSLPEHIAKRTLGYDCYEMAEEWGCSPAEAAQRMTDEGWQFQEYDAIYGTERYVHKTERYVHKGGTTV